MGDAAEQAHGHRRIVVAQLPLSQSSLLPYGLAEPLLKADVAESRVGGRSQRALSEFRPELPPQFLQSFQLRLFAYASVFFG
jgi:hypothetical protein